MSDLILFSGGCDSTLVLYKRAMEALQTNRGYDKVIALSINHNQCPSQNQQITAREKIKKEFEARQLPIEWLEVSINQSKNTFVNASGLVQPAIWLTTSSLYLRTGDILYCGYHVGDDYWRRKTECEESLHSFCKVLEKSNIKIEYPLEFCTKASIIKELKERNLYHLCWYCENPTFDDCPCGKCTPCETHKTALWQLETFDKYKDELKTEICSSVQAIPTDAQLITAISDLKKECDCIQGS